MMPYVISDSLFERLEGCVKQQRLLGVMGMLEELRAKSIEVDKVEVLTIDGVLYYDYWVETEVSDER